VSFQGLKKSRRKGSEGGQRRIRKMRRIKEVKKRNCQRTEELLMPEQEM